MSILAADISYWQKDSTDWQALWDAGVRLAIVGSAHPRPNPYAEGELRKARALGMVTATYGALYPGVPGEQVIATCEQYCGSEWAALRFVAVDAEIDGILVSDIARAVGAVQQRGKQPIIYTGEWWWGGSLRNPQGHFGGPTDFRDLPLWAANYAIRPTLDGFPLFAGWTSVTGHQYGGAGLAGVDCDVSIFREEFVMPEPDKPTDAQLLRAAGIFAQIAEEVAKGNYLLAGTNLRDLAKYLLRL